MSLDSPAMAEPTNSSIDLTAENITAHTIATNSQGPSLRLRYILDSLVTHLHDFARETQLTTEEWIAILRLMKYGLKDDYTCEPKSRVPAPALDVVLLE